MSASPPASEGERRLSVEASRSRAGCSANPDRSNLRPDPPSIAGGGRDLIHSGRDGGVARLQCAPTGPGGGFQQALFGSVNGRPGEDGRKIGGRRKNACHQLKNGLASRRRSWAGRRRTS